METSRVVRSNDPREVLALAQHSLGFRPTESLVVVALRPPRGRTGLVARVDLPDAGDPRVLADLARRVVEDGADRAVVVVLTDRGGARLPGARTARAARTAMAEAGVRAETWLARRDRLLSYTCTGRECCPPEGLPLGATVVDAAMVVAGSAPAPDRRAWRTAQLAALAPAPAGQRRAVEAAARAAEAGAGGQDAVEVWLGALEEAVRAVAAGEPPAAAAEAALPAARAAVLLVGLAEPGVRDAVLMTGAPGAPAQAPQDAGTAAAAQELLRRAARLAQPVRRARALACLAWLQWWCGDAAAAGLHAERALQLDPGSSLADLVARVVARGLAPDWALAPAGRAG